jgi:hypothetical protein
MVAFFRFRGTLAPLPRDGNTKSPGAPAGSSRQRNSLEIDIPEDTQR